jgi:hypothetical protein
VRFGASSPIDLPDGDGVVDLILSPTGGVDGVVEGPPDARGLVVATPPNDFVSIAHANTDATGAFHFDSLPPGDYKLSVGALPGRLGASTTVRVIANQRTAAKISVAHKRILLTVKVSGGSCDTVTLATAQGDINDYTAGFQRCSQGKAEFEIPPGNYKACPERHDCVPVTVAASPPAQTVEVRAPSK